ncbi:MAG: hypothetical protein V3V08_07560 [Nannocystaceae bacterium]
MENIEQDISTEDRPQADESADSRRSFLRGAATVAGVATAGAVLASSGDTQAAINPKLRLAVEPSPVSPTMRVSFSVRHKVRLEDIQEALFQVLDQTGCPTCGLNGLDLRFGLDEVLPLKTSVPTQAVMETGLLP